MLNAQVGRRTVTLLKSLYLSQFSGLSKGPFVRPISAAKVALSPTLPTLPPSNFGLAIAWPR